MDWSCLEKPLVFTLVSFGSLLNRIFMIREVQDCVKFKDSPRECQVLQPRVGFSPEKHQEEPDIRPSMCLI